MDIMPSEYQQLPLSRNEKIFVRNIMSCDRYGFLLLNTNPAMTKDAAMHILICQEGVLLFSFFDHVESTAQFELVVPLLIDGLYSSTSGIITSKLVSNKALTDANGLLKVPVNLIYAFPSLEKTSIASTADAKLRSFIKESCVFKEGLSEFRSSPEDILNELLSHPITETSPERMAVDDQNINSILQRLAPEYVTIRSSLVADEATKKGADNELLVVSENDAAVKAFRLDQEQINIVNKISKGDQLILACAGSGKSVLLISKCFKAAAMNPDKKFLITCYNRNLHSLYSWFIDRAGLREKNVTCMTFLALCRKLLSDNGLSISGLKNEQFADRAIDRFNRGRIKDRFYGIFIDEVQQFDPEWYKFCFNLLENKNTDDHLFVICGDKTQKLANLQRHGRAPWNVGEGYPNYRGGNKNIRIERNYRNCIEINEYINRFVSNAKKYLASLDENAVLDPDEFLRGKSVFHGKGVTIGHLEEKSNYEEARTVVDSIKKIHDREGIPYDEIAVIFYNKGFKKHIEGWKEWKYNLETPLLSVLQKEDIPYFRMYNSDKDWGGQYGDHDGVALITPHSVLGLDFRAAIFCGLIPLGEHHKIKKPGWEKAVEDEEKMNELVKHAQEDIRFIYVACTRAKEILYIILPEHGTESVYAALLEEAETEEL